MIHNYFLIKSNIIKWDFKMSSLLQIFFFFLSIRPLYNLASVNSISLPNDRFEKGKEGQVSLASELKLGNVRISSTDQ